MTTLIVLVSILIAIVLLVVAGVAVWWRWFKPEGVTNDPGEQNRITELEKEVSKHEGTIDSLSKQLEQVRVEKDKLQNEKEGLEKEYARRDETVKNMKEQAETIEGLIKKQEEGAKAHLEEITKKVLSDNKGELKKDVERSKNEMRSLLVPIEQKIGDFRKRVDEIHSAETKMHSALETQVELLLQKAVQYGQSADDLANALKGSSKTQGDWGEVVLSTLLEESGLSYETQKALRNEDGNSVRPDAVINLSQDRYLIVDAKVSLRAYEEFTTTQDPKEKQDKLKSHVEAVRSHVKELGDKNYPAAKDPTAPNKVTLRYVFMFMPIEPALVVALKKERNLFMEAYRNRVILCIPSTFMALLGTVDRIWREEQQYQNATQIADLGGKLHDKFVRFVDNLDKVGTALDKARESYDEAYKQLSTGRGNLVRQADKLRALQANTKKQLKELPMPEEEVPASLVAGTDESEEDDS